VQQPAPAKINLFLHVGARRADGFHPLQSLAVFTDLGDTLTFTPSPSLSLTLDGPFAAGLAAEPDNLVLRAARALDGMKGATLALHKALPVASGIGGGSADAAAALRGLNALWDLGRDHTALCSVAADLGSDIPVCIASRPAFMEGRGERLREAECLPHLALLLVNPGVAVPTRDVFAALQDRSGAEGELPRGRFRDTSDLLRFLETTRNDLEAPAIHLQPAIGQVLSALSALPGALLTRMSGSGATCFALFADDEGCARAAAVLRQQHHDWWIAPTFVPEHNITHEQLGRDFAPGEKGL
jgi:4-diphosphocytidyl-2-C-methyl-D-erythritol kinase